VSQQPPPPPYGGPPGHSPYGLPPSQPPPSGMSNKAKFWLGAVLALPAIIAGPLIVAFAVNIGQTISNVGPLSGILGGVASLALLVAFIGLIVVERTRWIGLGMLAGLGGLFILGAGACVALIVAYNNSV
jgi:hypothetical protein